MDKEEILNGIHTLLSKNVIGGKQMLARYKGFRGELFFENLLLKKYPDFEIMDGGIIMSKDSSESSLKNSMYFTILPNNTNLSNYREIYSKLSKIGFLEMYLILYNDEWVEKEVMKFENESINLKVPSFTIKKFDYKIQNFVPTNNDISTVTNFLQDQPKRNGSKYPIEDSCKDWLTENLTQFDKSQLLNIYMDRLFFDGYIGFSKNKGKSSDIDLIIKKPTGEYRLIEIKEKDLPKSKKGFGLDIPRIKDLRYIQEKSTLEYHVVIRHINNQIDRNLIDWKTISIQEFWNNVKDQKSIEGGTGMRSSQSSNPTLICSLSQFRNL